LRLLDRYGRRESTCLTPDFWSSRRIVTVPIRLIIELIGPY
jgi:hypothetical protein